MLKNYARRFRNIKKKKNLYCVHIFINCLERIIRACNYEINVERKKNCTMKELEAIHHRRIIF